MGEVKNGFLANNSTTMKNLNLFYTVVVSAAVLAGASGCKHRPPGAMPIPGVEARPSAEAPPPNVNPNPAPNLPVNPGPVVPVNQPITDQNIPINPNGKWPDLFKGPHNEDREKFQADTVYFEFDRATVKTSEENKLQDVAKYFSGNSTDALIVEGNCDERGTEKYNLSLGERRALAVREYLANLGMDPQRIKTVTYGASRPADPGHNDAAWSKNRRGDLILVTPK